MVTSMQIEAIRRLREECRVEDGGGGQCSVVSEELGLAYGWHIATGAYTALNGEVICEDHAWNVLPDGSIVDATADQFGEGFDVRIVAPTDPDYRRYRNEWSVDWNPDIMPVECPQQLGYSKWAGEVDIKQVTRLNRERGMGWWLQDKSAYLAYQAQQEVYAKRRERLRKPKAPSARM